MKGFLASLPPMTGHERSVLAATCLSSLGSFYTMTVTPFAMPQIQAGLAISEDAVGDLFAVLRFGALFSIALGVMADRLGRRGLLIASVGGCALSNVLSAFAQSGEQLAFLQMLSRLFVGAQILLSGVVVSEELSADNRGWGIGVLTAVGGLGGALTLLAYAFVDQLPYGWRALYVIGGFGGLCVPWLMASLRETRRFAAQRAAEPEGVDGGSAIAPLRDIIRLHPGRLFSLIAVIAPVAVILEPGSVFISKFLQSDLGHTPAQVSLMLALCGIATPLGNVLSGILTDRFGRVPGTALVSLLLSLSTALFYNAEGLVMVGLGLALLMLSIGGIQVLHIALSSELFPTALRSTASGAREAVSTLGASLGLWLTGALYGITASHAASITWILVLTPIAPIVLLFVPETARRELEEISDEAA